MRTALAKTVARSQTVLGDLAKARADLAALPDEEDLPEVLTSPHLSFAWGIPLSASARNAGTWQSLTRRA